VVYLPDLLAETKKLEERGLVGWERRLVISSRAHLGLSSLCVCVYVCVFHGWFSPDSPKPDSPKPDSPKHDLPKPDSPNPDSPKR